MSSNRNPDLDLAYGDLPPQRWDREKFERYSRRGGYDERDYYRFQERDRFGGSRDRRQVDLEVTERTSPRRFEERERFVEEDRYAPPARKRSEFLEESTQSEVARTALTPYRRKSIVEREVDVPVQRPRPQFIRRQSSLDTFDKRVLPRYGDEYHIAPDVPVPLPIRRPRSPPRERDRYREREFEEIRYRDLEPESFNEYEDIRIRRERSRGPKLPKSISGSRIAKSVRNGSSASSSSFEEIETVEKKETIVEIGKRGKTKMPKRLAHKQAIIEMGLPFVEEEDFIIIQRALDKEYIDEIIEKSKTYKATDKEKTVYKFEEKVVGGAFPPPSRGKVDEVFKRTEVIENPPALLIESRSRTSSPGRSLAPRTSRIRARSASSYYPSHYPREVVEERFEESDRIAGPLTLLTPERKSDREIRREIEALEAERRVLRLEREADDRRVRTLSLRDRGDVELVERRDIIEERPSREWETIRVEKDRKGRMALVKSTY